MRHPGYRPTEIEEIELSGGYADGTRIAVPRGMPWYKAAELRLPPGFFRKAPADVTEYDEVPATILVYHRTPIFTEDERGKVYRLEAQP